jgi:hypothetical protein
VVIGVLTLRFDSFTKKHSLNFTVTWVTH